MNTGYTKVEGTERRPQRPAIEPGNGAGAPPFPSIFSACFGHVAFRESSKALFAMALAALTYKTCTSIIVQHGMPCPILLAVTAVINAAPAHRTSANGRMDRCLRHWGQDGEMVTGPPREWHGTRAQDSAARWRWMDQQIGGEEISPGLSGQGIPVSG